ncbi:Acyl-CoA dehydrogenase/oxidase domain protein [Microbacterium esteraromaticum]|uniref:Acyl-CoA dehydrogenase/oxidase domain protein n=1 Tax=Microbacterium esteraromaticum TaxID=57043 RepID=A0A1R4K0Y5_9MICO|nr:acyl-CoA dehydrogenase [Microbacterium esteraromaticum]SJN37909.1 Acyl-CoA dehydrogenase/oxidase domain protein [Microbacterium esteraromaticum]
MMRVLTDSASAEAQVIEQAATEVAGLGVDLDATIGWAVRLGPLVSQPGSGRTAGRWSALATAASLDVAAARVLEPHLDALAIIAEAQATGSLAREALDAIGADESASWGVYAAEGPISLTAEANGDGTWRLDGTKSWCSLAGRLSHALVTAWVNNDERQLFAVSLRHPSVEAQIGPWVARGLSGIVSAAVDFHNTPAVPVGDAGWYLKRPGFHWGGMGVAAVWWGGVLPVADALGRAASRSGADQIAQMLHGEADAHLWATRVVLTDAAARIDASAGDARVLAQRVRAVTAHAAERVLTLADHGLGPGPLTTDEEHARRVSDLRIYLRQDHAERDLARLGRSVVA